MTEMKQSNDSWHVSVLRNELEQRQSVNPRYSLRSFARLIGVAPAVLSEVFRGKRKLPPKYADGIAGKLNFSPPKKKLFIRSIMLSKGGIFNPDELFESDKELSTKVLNEEIHGEILSSWEFYAVLSLMRTKDFTADTDWIADRLGITSERAKDVVEKLLAVQLIEEKEDGTWKRSTADCSTTIGKKSECLRRSHIQSLQMAAQAIEEVPMEQRFFTTETIAIDPNRLEEVRELLREMRADAAALMENGERTEVYQLGMHFFPLSRKSLSH